ncbi:multiple cyclophane-containing RiPP AmcA [Micromonospora sediminimaris]|uniref:Uncharacterized protein n=1 Tax=Micromonospora sediminimaris TaxID=547162 RepID=A0A9W5UX77_9ACTN|nr:multiple cyclophane-containing RiPP AmcA [Micromonospora sediminimaris]GIJ36310.1 hypothetical protein Vse01_54580 [Micromonospora sediminimaris]SFC03948.1 hypothetical protein SAMN05216284_102294 [Micromonospora sediminimaris]
MRPDAPASARAGHSVDRTDDPSYAYRHHGCVGGWPAACSPSPADGGGLAGMPASPPHTEASLDRGPTMTVYVSRYAETGELTSDRAAQVPALTRSDPADPPLLTHVWRIVFERQARERDPR